MGRPRKRRLAALVLAAGLTVGGTGAADAATVRVRGVGRVWTPKVRRIVPGTIVRWVAVNGKHNVRSRGANWRYFKRVSAGMPVGRRFNRRGIFRFYCTIHGHAANGVCHGMCGSIVVR
jgi:plastocyanin